MIYLLLASIICSFIFFVAGSFLQFEKYNKINRNQIAYFCHQSLLGIFFLSFVALLLNFISPLNKIVNTIVIIIFIFHFIIKNKFKIISNSNFLYYIISSSIITFSLLILSENFRPDSGLYHFPYVSILNNEKIIIGLSNIHFRFGHISIIQYTSAFLNNYFLGLNGIVMPIACLVSFIILYLLSEVLFFLRSNNKLNINVIFCLLTLIFITYKIKRYGEFGNDAPAHLLFFYLISIILNGNSDLFKKSLLISIFIFLNKSTLIFAILIPIIFLKKDKFFNFHNFFSISFFLIWCLKNILISSCLIYPLEKTCLTALTWHNDIYANSVKETSEGTEAWSKGWVDQKNERMEYSKYNSNFNWIKTWSEKHLKYILSIIIPYILFLAILLIIFKKKSEKNYYKISKIKNVFIIKYILSILTIGLIGWFLKAPLYRFGYSYFVNIINIIFSILIFKEINNTKKIKLKKVIYTLIFLMIFIFFSTQVLRIVKNYNIDYSNYPWPKYFSFSKENNKVTTKPIYYNGNLFYFKSEFECMYSEPPCTNTDVDKRLKLKIKNNYKIYYY